MHTIKLEIEDSKIDLVLSIIKSLKKDVITKYEVITNKRESKDFINISQQSLAIIEKDFVVSKLGRLMENDIVRLEKLVKVIC